MRIKSFATGLLVSAVLLSACNEDHTGCGGEVNSYTQTGNKIKIEGSFGGGQPVMQLHRPNGTDYEVAGFPYDQGEATFDITDLPAGTYTVTWLISCDDNSGEANLDGVKVPSVTIVR